MSDLDGDWKPNGRPQSYVILQTPQNTVKLIRIRTLARSFSAALNEAFMIDSSLDGLSQSVEQ
ncbi:MAG: hypothetical protein M1830_002398, partial [Pleopsidium flavum]